MLIACTGVLCVYVRACLHVHTFSTVLLLQLQLYYLLQLVNSIYSDASGIVCHWHVTTQTCISKIREARQTLAVAFAPDCSTFTTAGTDKRLLVYDEATQQLQSTLEARCV